MLLSPDALRLRRRITAIHVQMISTILGIRALESASLNISCGHKSPHSFSACPAAAPASGALGLRIEPRGTNVVF